MSASRLFSVLTLLLVSCAGWDSSTPSYAPPPGPQPVPSHYAPPPPVETPADPPPLVKAESFRAAIASVQLIGDCPDPAPAAAEPGRASQKQRAQSGEYSGDLRRSCTQSTVQLAVHSDFAGAFRVEAVRVLDGASNKAAGTAVLRAPTAWSPDGTYVAWDERVTAGAEHKISYKLADPDFSRAEQLVGPNFNTYVGPFILEMDVSINGQRRTIRSEEFTRQQLEVMVT